MDIKLKRYSVWLKTFAFVMIAAMSICIVLIGLKIQSNSGWSNYGFDINVSYEDTRSHDRQMYKIAYDIETVMHDVSEANILTGKFISQSDIDSQIQGMYPSLYEGIYQDILDEDITAENISETMCIDRFKARYKSELEEIRKSLIQNELDSFRDSLNKLKSNANIQYYINAEGNIYSNLNISYAEFKKGQREKYASDVRRDDKIISEYLFGLKPEYFDQQLSIFNNYKKVIINGIILGSICVLIILICLIYLIFAAGRKSTNPKVISHIRLDGIYNEFILALATLSAFGVLFFSLLIFADLTLKYLLMIIVSACVCATVGFILVLVRNIKSRTIIKNTLIYKFLVFLFRPIRKVYDAGTPMVKTLAIILLLGFFTMIPFVGFITIPLTVAFVYRQVLKYQSVRNYVTDIKNGNYDQNIVIKGTGEWAKLAADLNDISTGLGDEVLRRMKSERLKTDLIVNVSHDIKTPLTSIITYVDLLKKEDIPSEAAQKYIEILAIKSDRLKVLIDDLFEASKASSGNISVNLEEVNINALITQGLGELDDKVTASSLSFKVNLPEEPVLALADGRLLWRVLENLLSNVFKYSLPHSRVYINVSQTEAFVLIEIKNISACELNIPADEITERFKRGDLSRNSEGSGLGLDIAKSLMQCQKGELNIHIDGDLFKVVLQIPKSNK